MKAVALACLIAVLCLLGWALAHASYMLGWHDDGQLLAQSAYFGLAGLLVGILVGVWIEVVDDDDEVEVIAVSEEVP